MPTLPGGITFEQMVVTVANNDTAINNELTTQATQGWIAWQFILNGANMTIAFSRTVVPT